MKVTKQLFDEIKKSKAAPSVLSDRTVKNIFKCKTYTEYKQKFCQPRKQKVDTDIIRYYDNLMIDVEIYYRLIKRKNEELFKLILINMIVTIIGLTVIIGLIAW